MAQALADVGELLSGSWPIAILVALVAGVLSSFSPCVLASVSLVVGYVGGYSGGNRRKAVAYSALFCLGLILTFTALGYMAASFGRLMSGVGRGWYLTLGAGMLALGLWIAVGARGPAVSCRLPKLGGGPMAALAMGGVAGLVSSPCATPALAAILGLVAGTGSPAYGALLLATYAVGHSALVFLAGCSIGFVQTLSASAKVAKLSRLSTLAVGALVALGGAYMLSMGL